MNSFVITANPPSSTAEPVVTNDGWFPDLNPAEVRNACRLGGTVTAERLRPALMDAMLAVNAELAEYRHEQQSRWGYASLGDVHAAAIGGQSAKLLYYARAVHYGLMADLAEAYRNLSTLPSGTGKEDQVMQALIVEVDEHRRKQRWAISDLLGRARCTVELL